MRVSGVERLDGAVITTGGRDRYKFADDETKVYQHLMENRCVMRQPGSAALDLAYIAAGRIDGLWMRGLVSAHFWREAERRCPGPARSDRAGHVALGPSANVSRAVGEDRA